MLRDVRVRQAIAYAIDRKAIIEYLRRGLGVPAVGLLPALSWAFAADAFSFPYDPARARALLDEAGYLDPDGDGPRPRLRLSLKTSSTLEFNRLQATVIQQNLRAVGIDLDVRSYEFATLFADVLKGNFQMYTLQWTAGSLADPDILRRVFHSTQVPPAGFNRGYYSNPRVDALLDQAATSADQARRIELFKEVQRLVALDVPYVSLWNKTNIVDGAAIPQRHSGGRDGRLALPEGRRARSRSRMKLPFEYEHVAVGEFGGAISTRDFDRARVVILPVPLDRTTSYVAGTRNGPHEILVASSHLETWDEETQTDIHGIGILTLPEMEFPFASMDDVMAEIRRVAGELVQRDKFPVVLGGEHSITAPVVAAVAAKHPGLSVLQIDAHADLRESFMGTPHSHACAMRRVLDFAPTTQVGIRSLSPEEAAAVPSLRTTIFYDYNMRQQARLD